MLVAINGTTESNIGALTYLLPRLAHLHLLLHLDHLLLLGKGQCPRHAQQQGTGAHDKDGLAAERQPESDPASRSVGCAGDVVACGWRDDISER